MIISLQSDWGEGEYRSLKSLLDKLGIQFRHSRLHTHQQNGRAERKHRHITEIGLTLLVAAHLPPKFWLDAFSTTVHLINCLPYPSLNIHHKPVIWCDNKSATVIASNPVYHARTKHIEIDTHFVRDKVQKKELDVCHISTRSLDDIFIKPIPTIRLCHLLEKFPIEKW